MIYKAPILSDCTFFVYESHIDQQPVMVNGPTVNTHTRTSAACFEFLRMISFRRTFLSDYQKRMEKLSSQVGFMIVAWHWGQTHTHTHTLSLRASISLSVIFHGHSVLCCCAVLSSSCASFSLKGATFSSKTLVLMTTKKFCYCDWVLKFTLIRFHAYFTQPRLE